MSAPSARAGGSGLHVIRVIGRWFEDRTGLIASVRPMLEHPVPADAGWLYVFGSATAVAFLLQLVTGAALASLYVPSTRAAYETLQTLSQADTLGRLLRGMHFFGASAMILLVGLHMIRVFLTGAYKFPRELNWLSGVLLFALTLGMGFTGQLLRWDQNAVWSVVVGAEQAGRTPFVGDAIARVIMGGPTLGAATLTRFFALHVFAIPGLIIAMIGLHVYLVLRHGVSEMPRAGEPVDPVTYRQQYEEKVATAGVRFWPHAAWRDMLVAALVVIAVVALAWIWGPPALDRAPDPSAVVAHPRPDWYFLFYFALLALMPHGLEDYVIILGPLLVFAALVALPLVWPHGERSPRRRPWAVVVVAACVTIIGALTISGVKAHWSPDFGAQPLPAGVIASDDPEITRGAALFHDRACIYCHDVGGYGGHRGPELTHVGTRLGREQMVIRIMNGGYNMPGFGAILKPDETDALVAFLTSRR